MGDREIEKGDRDLDAEASLSRIGAEEDQSVREKGEENMDPTTRGSTRSNEPPTKESRSPTRSQTATLMLALCLAVFLAALDAVIITTALPTISRDISASGTGSAWIGASYLLANAASVPFWGKVSDIFGRKPILLIADVVFMAGNFLSALAKSLGVLVAGRAVQGLGAGGLMVLVNTIVGDLFSPRERGLYFGMVGAVWGLASGCGPLIGGGLTQGLSWRWCFWINLPLSGLSLLMLVVCLRVHTPKTPLVKGLLAMDWPGTVTFTGATAMLLSGLEMGGVQERWTSPMVLCLILGGAATYALFAFTQVRLAGNPIVPPSLLKPTSSAAIYASNFFHGLTFAGIAFFLPLYFQAVLGASPVESGVWLLATALPLALCTVSVGVVIRFTGRYVEVIRFSSALAVLGTGLFVLFNARRNWLELVLFQILAALGVAPNLQALLIALQALVRKQDLAAGTATFAFVRHVAVGIGVVIGEVVLRAVAGSKVGDLVEAGIDEAVSEAMFEAGGFAMMTGGDLEGLGLTKEQGELVRRVLADSFSWLWVFYCVAAGVGLVSTLAIKQVELSKSHVEARTGLEADEAKREETVSAEGRVSRPKAGDQLSAGG